MPRTALERRRILRLPFRQTTFRETEAQFSPGSDWIAYVSNESGRNEVYVAPFPGPGARFQISMAGGSQPRWRRDGKEIFYVAPNSKLMAVTVNIRGSVVEASAALSILLYLVFLWLSGRSNQKFSAPGFNYSVLTGICVGAGTIAFFLLFQKGGPLSSVPAILAGGSAIMAVAGILFFREAASWQRILGVVFAIIGLFLLRK